MLSPNTISRLEDRTSAARRRAIRASRGAARPGGKVIAEATSRANAAGGATCRTAMVGRLRESRPGESGLSRGSAPAAGTSETRGTGDGVGSRRVDGLSSATMGMSSTRSSGRAGTGTAGSNPIGGVTASADGVCCTTGVTSRTNAGGGSPTFSLGTGAGSVASITTCPMALGTNADGAAFPDRSRGAGRGGRTAIGPSANASGLPIRLGEFNPLPPPRRAAFRTTLPPIAAPTRRPAGEVT